MLSSAAWAGPSMDSAANLLARNVVNGGGLASASASYDMVGSVGEEVAFTTQAAGVSLMRAGWSELHAFPGVIGVVTPVTGVSASSVTLVFNAPGYDGFLGSLQVGTSYLVRVASYTVPDTFSSYTFANQTISTSAVNPGDAVGAEATGLLPSTIYFAQFWTVDADGNVALAPSQQATFTTPAGGLIPFAPTGLIANGGLLTVPLTWEALPLPGQGSGLRFYRVSRSLTAGSGYVSLATTTATAFLDKPLSAGVTYYYKVSAQDVAAVEGPLSAAASAVPYTLLPMEPIGMKVAPSASAVTLTWSPTQRFTEGSPFVSTGAPSADELAGYTVYRATNICEPNFVNVGNLPSTATAVTDNTGGLNYFYRVCSYNSLGTSSNVVTLSSLGERSYFLDDCTTRAVLDDKTAAALNADVNGVGDIRLARTRRPQDVGNGVFQSVEFKPMLNGSSELKDFVLPSTAPAGSLSAAAFAPAAGATTDDLGAFWYNGAEFKKMYGRIDPAAQTVTVESPNLGVYQVRAQARSAGAVFDISNLSGRVITPNGDGLNDVAIFTYDPGPKNISPAGRVFDVRGSVVAEMLPGLVPNTLTWDGRMSGRPATSGVYAYRITGDGKTFTGTTVVAR